MSAPFSGGCRCGAVRYECTSEPLVVAHCHCRDCQRSSGGGLSTVLIVPRAVVEITGETRAYSVDAESGNRVTRRFCPVCGSPLFSELSGGAGMLAIKAGSLDAPDWLQPSAHVWTASAPPWSLPDDGLPRFEKNPTS